MQSMSLSFQPAAVRLVLTERSMPAAGARPVPLAQRRLTLTASNLLELRGKHPDEFRRFVAPALRRMLGKDPLAVRAADAYRAFAEVPADALALRQLHAILEKFESADASVREKASAHLAGLGAAGVLAALRIDREALTAEQRSRLDEFVVSHDDRRFAGEQTLSDVAFLIDCLEFEDVRVRRAARDRLAAVLGRAVEVDPEAPPDARAAATDRLRDELGKLAATRPATQPAVGPQP
jgi:hypothetical protein